MQDQDFTIKFIGESYSSYAKGIHQIWCRSAKKLLCPHEKSTYVRTSRQTDRQTEIFFGLFCLLRHKNHKHLSKGENFFFSHAIIILSLFTYSVCDEKVKTSCESYHHSHIILYTAIFHL